jgi:hypothetical protein
MVKLLPGFPPHVAAYRAAGKVNETEYENVVMERVNQVAKKFGRINFLVRLDTPFTNYSLRTFLKYIRISFAHFRKWSRMAIVTDERWVRRAYRLLNPLVHGELKVYPLTAFEEAKQWVAGPLDAAMGPLSVLGAGLLGTTGMTAFSHWLSRRDSQDFSEPRLLDFLFRQWELPGPFGKAGWQTHYTLGIGWAGVYAFLLKNGYIRAGLLTTAGMGILSGVLAAGCWKGLFLLSPETPPVNQRKFFLQMIPAHLVFTGISVAILRLSEQKAPGR